MVELARTGLGIVKPKQSVSGLFLMATERAGGGDILLLEQVRLHAYKASGLTT